MLIAGFMIGFCLGLERYKIWKREEESEEEPYQFTKEELQEVVRDLREIMDEEEIRA